MIDCSYCGNPTQNKKFCSRRCSNEFFGKLKVKKNSDSYLRCVSCNKLKAQRFFSYNIRGNVSSGRKTTCKRCGANKRERKRRERNWKCDAQSVMFNNCKQRAKRTGITFSITKEDIVIPDLCPVFGIELKRCKKDNWNNSPSLDRIDNSKGYIKGNIVVVSRRANILKKDATIEELELLAKFYKRYKK